MDSLEVDGRVFEKDFKRFGDIIAHLSFEI